MPTPFTRIESRQHPVVRACRAAAAGRGSDGLVLLDGEHLLIDAAGSDVEIDTVLVDDDAAAGASRAFRAVLDRLARAGAAIYAGASDVLAAASPVRTASGVVALARWSPVAIDAVWTPPPALVVGLVGVQDPGNLGAAIRSADALGATGVVAADAAADPGGWKALRGAMGSTFRVPVARAPLASLLADAAERRVSVVAAAARGGMPLSDLVLHAPTLLLFGSEGAGLPARSLPPGTQRLTVPMRDGVESLNVAVAVSLALYEARRQRAATGR